MIIAILKKQVYEKIGEKFLKTEFLLRKTRNKYVLFCSRTLSSFDLGKFSENFDENELLKKVEGAMRQARLKEGVKFEIVKIGTQEIFSNKIARKCHEA